jgi:hypothetical protein
MAAPISVAVSRHLIEGSIAGRANLQYFDPSRNMRFSPAGGGPCVMQLFCCRTSVRSTDRSRWNVDD